VAVHDEAAFEAAIEADLLAGGWEQSPSSNYRPELGLDTAELMTFLGATQQKALDKLIGYYGDLPKAQRKVAERIAKEIDARGTLDVLRRGVKDHGVLLRLAYFAPAHSITPQLREQYERNRLTVTRQLRYSATTTDALDLALFVNGIPVATAELKNELTGQSVEHAKAQYRTDRDPRELLFAKRALVHFAVDQDLVFLTTRLARGDTRFLPFNLGTAGPGVAGGAGNPVADAPGTYRTSYVWRRVWQCDAWLDLLARFLHAEDGSLIFPRLHQWDAVLALTADAAKHGAGRNYLVQHSAGSGKSNTIAWLAHRLASLHDTDNRKVFAKVVVVTDRVVLDRQLQETIFQFDHVPGVVQRIDGASKQLADALAGETAQVVITTLQKFPYAMEQMTRLAGTRFAVIVDEAHSSQTGETAKALKQVLSATGDTAVPVDPDTAALNAAAATDTALEALAEEADLLTDSALARGRHENLSFFAFTATPKAKTLELFGTPEHGTDADGDGDPVVTGYRPFHTYSMRQAIEEGFILDVLRNYVTYATYYKLANASPDDPELDVRKASAQLARFASLHPTNMDQRAEVIVEHFRSHTRRRLSGRAKAMVVTRSRLHAVRTYQAIRAYVARKGYPDCHALVAFSGPVTDGGVEHTEAFLNGFGEAALPARFAYTAADDPHAGTPAARQAVEYHVLVVAEKYQTGFDQPLLTTMYVDKKLEGVKAVQTLSRINRTHPLKEQEDVFVLDFANSAEDIQAAFEPFYETTLAEPTDPHMLYALQSEVMGAGLLAEPEMQNFVEAYLGLPPDANEKAHAALYRFTEPAMSRYVALAGSDAAAADEFRSTMRSYTRAYAFLAAIMAWHDPDLERLYLYGKYLLLRLPRRSDPGVDVGAVELTHLRVARTGQTDASLGAGSGDQVLPGFTGAGLGALGEKELLALSEIIESLNDKFGHELTEADQLVIEQHVVTATGDEELRAAATANTLENYGYVFDRRFEELMLDRHEANAELIRRFLDEPEVNEVFTSWARQESYRRIREAGEEAS
jgi:type I restriction enzyme R subunit